VKVEENVNKLALNCPKLIWYNENVKPIPISSSHDQTKSYFHLINDV
jgi:hypothetical protein